MEVISKLEEPLVDRVSDNNNNSSINSNDANNNSQKAAEPSNSDMIANNNNIKKKAVTFSEDNYVSLRRMRQLCSDKDDDETSTLCDDSGFYESEDRTYDEIPSHQESRPLRLRPLFFEVPASVGDMAAAGRHSRGRRRVFEAVEHELAAAPVRGVIISGRPATGKTSAILDLVLRSAFGRPANHSTGSTAAERLAAEVVGYHFLQESSPATCDIGRLVHSLAAQLSQHPALTAYHNFLVANPGLADLLTPAALQADPARGLVEAILQPLSDLYRQGALPLQRAIIVIDSLQEEEDLDDDDNSRHCQEEVGKMTVSSFLTAHLLKFPHWLKLILTVDSAHQDLVDLMHLPQIHLDGEDQQEAVLEYIEARLFSLEARLLASVHPLRRPAMLVRLVNLLVQRSHGSFLYPQLVLDQLEAGRLVLKSETLSVIPRDLGEALQLCFSLRFPSAAAYDLVSDLFSICLASVEPLSLDDAYEIYQSSPQQAVSYAEFFRGYGLVSDILVRRSDDSLMFQHSLITKWLTGPEAGRFRVRSARGHDLYMHYHNRSELSDLRSTSRGTSVLDFVYHLDGCELFGRAVEDTPEMREINLQKWLHLNFKVERKDLRRAADQFPTSPFSGNAQMKQLLNMACGNVRTT